MRRFATVLFALLMLCAARAETAPSRIKDLVDVEGVRQNQLVGYGLVVGLNGTGDKLKDGGFTKQSLQSMLNRLGVKPTEKGTTSKNVAAVMVTAALPPFARQGSRIDVSVSALGDASSLLGGTLLVDPGAARPITRWRVESDDSRLRSQPPNRTGSSSDLPARVVMTTSGIIPEREIHVSVRGDRPGSTIATETPDALRSSRYSDGGVRAAWSTRSSVACFDGCSSRERWIGRSAYPIRAIRQRAPS